MTKQQAVQLFEEKKIRSVWDDEQEKWYFSIADVVEVLTETSDVKQYIKKMRMRDSSLNSNWGTICTPVRLLVAVLYSQCGTFRQIGTGKGTREIRCFAVECQKLYQSDKKRIQ